MACCVKLKLSAEVRVHSPDEIYKTLLNRNYYNLFNSMHIILIDYCKILIISPEPNTA